MIAINVYRYLEKQDTLVVVAGGTIPVTKNGKVLEKNENPVDVHRTFPPSFCRKWYLGHLLCDACGRLWLKDKYCPVCYKVYRNSELGMLSACVTCGHQVKLFD